MNTRTNRRTMLGMLALGVTGLVSLAIAADDDMAALQERFKARYTQLSQLKQDGKVGETSKGFVEAVKAGDADADKLVKEENSDREKLYALIAEKEKTTPEKVADRNATRNYEKAKPGEYFKGKDGKWTQKK